MKKFFSVMVAALGILTVASLASCSAKEEEPGKGNDGNKKPNTDDIELDLTKVGVLNGSEYYIFALPEKYVNYLGDKVKYNFSPNDNSRWLYDWNETGGSSYSKPNDAFGGAEGLGMGMSAGNGKGWAGFGLCVNIQDTNNPDKLNIDEDKAALKAYVADIAADQEGWIFALSMINTDAAPIEYYINLPLGNAAADGSDQGKLSVTVPADGLFHAYEFKYTEIGWEKSQDGNVLGRGDKVVPTQWANPVGQNIFCFGFASYVDGADANIGYAFAYKK